MKKTIIMAMALVLALPVVAATPRRTTQKRAVKTATVKPHISIAGVPFALTSADKLTLDPDPAGNATRLEHPEGVRSVKITTPVFDGDFESRTGAEETYEFDRNGRLTAFSEDLGDAAGGRSFKVFYSGNEALPDSLRLTSMVPTQDPCSDNMKVVATYIFTKDGGRITGFSEHTTMVGARKADGVFNYSVSYYPDGVMKQIVCKEQPAMMVRFDRKGNIVKVNRFIYDCNEQFRPAWISDSWENAEGDMSVYGTPPADVKHKTDSRGNWIEETWTESWEGSAPTTNGRFRSITYYD